jgi:hypothetical protein
MFMVAIGALLSQLILPSIPEHTMLTSILLLQSLGAFAFQMVGIGSAAVFFLSAFPLFIALLINRLLVYDVQVVQSKGKRQANTTSTRISRRATEISLWTYALSLVVPLIAASQTIAAVCQFFVPLVC